MNTMLNNAGTLKRKPTKSPHYSSSIKFNSQKIAELEGILYSKLAALRPIGTPWPPEIEIDEMDVNDLSIAMLQNEINIVDIYVRKCKEYDEMQAALTRTVESFNDLKAMATKDLKHAWSKVEVAQAEVTAAKEKINILEAASNEEKIEKLITENQDCTEALKKANVELQVALSDLGTVVTKNNLLQTANNESMITINRLRAENEDTQAELNFVKNKNNCLEAAANEWYNFTKKLKVECEEHKKDFKLAKAELELLHKLIASSATVEAQLVDASLNDIADIENTAGNDFDLSNVA
ncbi:hypothetical protein FRX31_004631 [Thalictrum thalictroides]|uniref:Uncharacterized protein n=1 Tax=Thalictrum thalictroides TaxID=46969 RepID=A0A7J6XBN6_THATH|nr:hypothetical protein FRX31_004631 [Thalictrum thalictroides]